MRVNKDIRVPRVRVISHTGEQLGVLPLYEALDIAAKAGLDLVEISPGATPPVCKVINYGKYRYDQTKREKENKKAQHQIKVKEVKLKPNIDEHDFQTKLRHAREFVSKGNKVKITCTFRGREMMHAQIGEKLLKRMCDDLDETVGAQSETPPKQFGRMLSVVLAPGPKKQKKESKPLDPKRDEEEK